MTTPLQTRVAGIFAFWPLLAQLGFDELVKQAGYPGSGMVPATSALLGLLALKLIDKERRSHISDFNFDEALGLFAGLNLTFRRWSRQFPGIFQRSGQPATPVRRSADPGPGGE